MPRTGRGGPRTGTPGVAYSNRTDLNQPNRLPPTAATGQPYGQAKAQLDAQQAIPLQSGPSLPTPPPAAAPDVPYQLPQAGDFLRPTERPDEPVTAGVPVGPGPGPEALSIRDDQGLTDILGYLPALEILASQPGSSQQLRTLVRRIRAGQA